MWKNKYKVIKIIPGIIEVSGFGRIDLRDDKLPLDLIEKLHKTGCPYLRLRVEKNKTDKQQPIGCIEEKTHENIYTEETKVTVKKTIVTEKPKVKKTVVLKKQNHIPLNKKKNK